MLLSFQTQFVLIFFHTIQTTFTGCDFPLWSHILLSSYMISMMVLFGNFYLQTYIKNKRAGYKKTDQAQNGVSKNGSVTHGNGVNGHSNGIANGHSKSDWCEPSKTEVNKCMIKLKNIILFTRWSIETFLNINFVCLWMDIINSMYG